MLSSDVTLKKVENLTTIKLIENTINSILIYGTEALILRKKDLNRLDSIQYNAARNLFALPWATPRKLLLNELDITPMSILIQGRSLEYLIKIKKEDNTLANIAYRSIG